MTDAKNPSAFPVPPASFGPAGDFATAEEGMTLRDWFAGQALPYAASRNYSNDWGVNGKEYPSLVAAFAYRLADAMLAARVERS